MKNNMPFNYIDGFNELDHLVNYFLSPSDSIRDKPVTRDGISKREILLGEEDLKEALFPDFFEEYSNI